MRRSCFVGLVVVLLGLVIEWFQRNNLGTIMAGFSGLTLLLVAARFSSQGDTMGVVVAVLDSNFWLATHVVCITIGYAGCVAAGVAGHVYLLQALFRTEEHPALRSTMKSLYGLLAFGLIFSFLGTMLGGRVGGPVVGPVLGLGSEGERRVADCVVVRVAVPCPAWQHDRRARHGGGQHHRRDHRDLRVAGGQLAGASDSTRTVSPSGLARGMWISIGIEAAVHPGHGAVCQDGRRLISEPGKLIRSPPRPKLEAATERLDCARCCRRANRT
jgi:uncharacterized membrane protein (UPF0136 family)